MRRVDDVLEPRHADPRRRARRQRRAARADDRADARQPRRASSTRREAKGVGVLLAGMEAPTNLGQDYRDAFHAGLHPARAATYRTDIAFVPFLLEGVAGNPALNQADGIHPNAEGRRRSSPRRSIRGCARSSTRWAAEAVARDRAHRRVANRHERRRPADHPSSHVLPHRARPIGGDHRSVGQRQVHAARTHRRARRADDGPHPARRHGHHGDRARRRWRGCAARRSGSSFSSST